MSATQCLRDEHQLILKILNCFEIALNQAVKLNSFPKSIFEMFTEFFTGYADQCHHCKEENSLFPKLEKQGIPREGGPIGVMIYEHELGRQHVRIIIDNLNLADSGDPQAIQELVNHSTDFIALLRQHIQKEDQILFSMADQVIHDSALLELSQAYSESESDTEYHKKYTKCVKIAHQLMETFSIS